MIDPPNRRPNITDEVRGDGFELAVTVGFDPDFGNPCEVFLTKRGKSGSELEATLYELGVLASKIMQENDKSRARITHLQEEVDRLKKGIKALGDPE
jgi:hypothetical protein